MSYISYICKLSSLIHNKWLNGKKGLLQKLSFATAPIVSIWRRNRDSNPSRSVAPLSVFETDPFNHLGISPGEEDFITPPRLGQREE